MTSDPNPDLHGRYLPDYRAQGVRPARGARTTLLIFVLIVAAVGCLAAGVYWHEPIAAVFGQSEMISTQPMAAGEPAKSKQLWTCGMHPQVIQDHPGDCPICHMKLTPLKQDGDSDGQAPVGAPKIAYWWDPMIGPASIANKPGKSAMGMDLVPVYEKDVSGGMAVKIDPVVVQNMGVRVATVIRGPLQQTVRAVGYLEEAQPLIHDVNLRVSGWIEKLYAATEGQHVERGAPLFDLYSPEVQIAVQELIAARKAGASSGSHDDLANQTSQTLLQSGRGKLDQWGLDAAQIEQLASLDQAPRTVTFKSPVSGHVTVKNVVDGSSVKAGDRVLQIVDHGTLWLDTQVYEQDLPYVRIGQTVTAAVQAMQGKPVEGKIIFISPHVDPATRTATVRMAIPNPDMALRPGMYATAEIASVLSDNAVLVPREAVIDTGTRAITFVSAGNGRFEPRSLKLGVSGANDVVELLSGVSPGETVVTSGQFLLDAESRMKEAIQRHLDQQLLMPAESKNAMSQAPANGNAAPTSTTGMPDMLERSTPGGPKDSASKDGMKNDGLPKSMADMPDISGPATSNATPSNAMTFVDADGVYRAYLALVDQFAPAESTEYPAVDVKPVMTAARALAESNAGKGQSAARHVLDTATALDAQKPQEQRRGFKELSDAVLALTAVLPPTEALGTKLFVAHCPMAFDTGADWLQAKETITNPYLADMRTCGSVTRTIRTVAAKAKQ